MRPAAALFRVRFVALLQYRAAALAGLATQVFWGFIRVMILTAFYASAAGTHPLTLADAVSYVWLSQAFFGLLPIRAEPDMEDLVRGGNVVYELLRPVGLFPLLFARSLSYKAAPTALRAVPLLSLALLFFGLGLPASPAAAALFAASLTLALLLSAAITSLLTTTLLFTVSARGVNQLVQACLWLLSGMVLPLPLFPDWAQTALAVLPFRGLVDAPYRIWFGDLAAGEALLALAHQAAWAAAIAFGARALLARAARRLTVQGG